MMFLEKALIIICIKISETSYTYPPSHESDVQRRRRRTFCVIRSHCHF